MKKKILALFLAGAVVLAGATVAQAVSLQGGANILKTYNYELGTAYTGGEAGKFYFRTAATSYDTHEWGFLEYTGAADQGLFTDLGVFPYNGDEDTFGLLRVTELRKANVTGTDSPFGDGSNATPRGNSLSPAGFGPYWTESENEHLLGIMWGSQDQVVECIVPNSRYRIWASEGQFDVFVVNGEVGDPFVDTNLDPTNRIDEDEFANWFDRNNDELWLGGSFDYFRFQGDSTDPLAFNGDSEVLLSFTRGSASSVSNSDWWTAPSGVVSDMWQSWNIGDPVPFANGWVGSEDSGRFYVVPEPVTMLGLFLAVGSLGGYIRKRQMA